MQRDRWSVCSSSDQRTGERGASGKEVEVEVEEGGADHDVTSGTRAKQNRNYSAL